MHGQNLSGTWGKAVSRPRPSPLDDLATMNLSTFPQQQGPPSCSPLPMQRRVQFVALLQLAEPGTVDRATTVAICPGTDRRDLEAALGSLVDEGSIEGPTERSNSLVALAEAGRFTLTTHGQRRLAEDDI